MERLKAEKTERVRVFSVWKARHLRELAAAAAARNDRIQTILDDVINQWKYHIRH